MSEENTLQAEDKKKSLRDEIFDFLKDLITIVIVVVIVRTFFILPFQISGQSMYDSYYDREFIIVNRFSYLTYDKPKRWDVIVFNTHIDGKEYFIKRIIWVPWDTLKISSWSVFVKSSWSNEFKELDEKYLSETNYKSTYVKWSTDEVVYEVPKDSYFVMWDNRNGSTDSRACFSTCELSWKSNFISKKDIVWKIFIDLWYFNFKTFSFTNPNLGINTKPKWFSSPESYNYE